MNWVPGPDELGAGPSAAWLIDTHRGLDWRRRLAAGFDLTFVAQRSAVAPLVGDGLDARWLPLAAPMELCAPGPDLAARVHDVAFVGQAPPGSTRARVLADVARHFDVVRAPGFLAPDRMMDLYRSARIVLNLPLARDLNMRTFEAAGARALLVTGPAEGLDAVLPSDMCALVESTEPAAWADAVAQALEDPRSQRRADRAHAHVLAHHTYDHRAAVVLDALRTIEPRGIDPAVRHRAVASAYARWGSPGAVARLELPFQDRARMLGKAVGWRMTTVAGRRLRGRTTQKITPP